MRATSILRPRTVEPRRREARELTEAAKKYKVSTQQCNQGTAPPTACARRSRSFRAARSAPSGVHVWTNRPVAAGTNAIGRLEGVQAARTTRSAHPEVPRPRLYLFLGTAPYRPNQRNISRSLGLLVGLRLRGAGDMACQREQWPSWPASSAFRRACGAGSEYKPEPSDEECCRIRVPGCARSCRR
jgi:hypothetical protein